MAARGVRMYSVPQSPPEYLALFVGIMTDSAMDSRE